MVDQSIRILEALDLSSREADYLDVRLEEVRQTRITTQDHALQFSAEENQSGAMVRVRRGERWHCVAVDHLSALEATLDRLAPKKPGQSARRDSPPQLAIRFAAQSVAKVPFAKKRDLLLEIDRSFQRRPYLVQSSGLYKDTYKVVTLKSSDGRFVSFDRNYAGLGFAWSLKEGERLHHEFLEVIEPEVARLEGQAPAFASEYTRATDFFLNSAAVEPGDYPVVLAPKVAGAFAHESFGHKSEADFMVGDETAKREWALGTRVGSDLLSIVDEGGLVATGYTPYDDEGTPAQKNYLIKNGILAGRLHSRETAATLDESPTGNARAMSFLFEPIVRMTNTYIEAGSETFEQLLAPIRKGIYVHDLFHGSGLSTFTLAPRKCWLIEEGRLTRPVRVSVLTGTVFETLKLIDGVSRDFHLQSGVRGGCGKFEQWPLPVSFGGPFVRVAKMRVS